MESALATYESSTAARPITLDSLPRGARAIVQAVSCGEKNLRNKLLVMGITSGVHVEIVGVAPLGDPITIRLRGFNLSLRRSEAAYIHVIPY